MKLTLIRTASRRWKVCLAFVGILIMLWLLASFAVAYRLTRRSRPIFAEPAPSLDWGVLEPLRLTTRDGLDLGAWLLPGRADAPSVVLIHGYSGSRLRCLDRGWIYAGAGSSVLMVSLRAHGDSAGEFNDIGFGARRDVIAAVEFLERRRPGRPILIHGLSLGAAAAVFASGELGGRVRGYVLESPFKDLKTAVKNRLENHLPPVLDWFAYQGLLLVSHWVIPHLDEISPVKAIDGIPGDIPVLIMAGDRDTRARPDEARSICDRVQTHASLSVYEGAGHLEHLAKDPDRFRDEILGFLHQASNKNSQSN